MQLYIGNKNYSSWSMRPWVLMRQREIEFDEVMVRFDGFDAGSRFKREVARVTPAGRVPVLVDGGLAVWDTLAIVEYLAEKFPGKALWPKDSKARARARSVCCEMHSGFGALRSAMPMNIEASLPEVGKRVVGDPAVRTDVERVTALWRDALDASGGPLLFADFSIADAMFAPVVMRFLTYRVDVPENIARYLASVATLESVRAWTAEARAENDFLSFEEPYRQAPG